MRRLLAFLVLLSALPVGLLAQHPIHLGIEIELSFTDEHWLLQSDGAYPFELIHDNLPADLAIFRSDISRTDAVNDENALKESVDIVIEQVIMALPNAQLLSSSGFYERDRAGFVLEFLSDDTVGLVTLHNRLLGVVYRKPDGGQILFSLWGKADEESWPLIEEEIKLLQGSFTYTGPAEADVVGATHASYPEWRWGLLVLGIGLIAVLMRKRRGSLDRVVFARKSSFWRCSCGRLNHNRTTTCRRCGQTSPTVAG